MADRTHFLGGSDVAGILGLSPWATPLDVYYSKVGYPADEGPDPKKEKIFRRGRRMEPVVVDMVLDEYPIQIVKRSTEQKPNRYVDKKLSFLAAEIDFEWLPSLEMEKVYPLEIPDGILNGEVKTARSNSYYGLDASDEIPVQYACQAMHGLGITGREACLVTVLFGNDDLRLYHVLRNDDLILAMREKCEKFWMDHVHLGVPPPPSENADVFTRLRVSNDIVVQAGPELRQRIADLVAANELKRVANTAAEKAQFEVIRHLFGDQAVEGATAEGKHVIMAGTEKLVTINRQSRDTLQAKLLKEQHPEIYAQYVKTTSYFVTRTNRRG